MNKDLKDNKIESRVVHLVSIFLFFTIVLFFCILCVFSYYSSSGRFSYINNGELGDVVGGVTSPFIGIITATLTFLAFWIQYNFNKIQNSRIDQQEIEFKRDKIESRFYEMLSIHIENVESIKIKDVSSARRAFVSMFKEFKFCYYVLCKIIASSNGAYDLNEQEKLNIAYLIFFFGIGESSEQASAYLFDKKYNILLEMYIKKLYEKRKEWSTNIIKIENEAKMPQTRDIMYPEENINVKYGMGISKPGGGVYKITLLYAPFDGHVSRLSHYYRHLFQTVKYIDSQPRRIFSKKGKYNLIRTLRAQLSAHEQLMLYYNAMSVLGSKWFDDKFIIKYKMVKNMPLTLADIGLLPNLMITEENYFEWDELRSEFGIE